MRFQLAINLERLDDSRDMNEVITVVVYDVRLSRLQEGDPRQRQRYPHGSRGIRGTRS